MSDTLGERLEMFIQHKKLNKIQFGAAFRATRQEVSNWCNGRGLAVNRLADMAPAYPDLNLHWLLIGKPYKMLNPTDESGEVIKLPPATPEELLRAATAFMEAIREASEKQKD